ncbi:c-type cytochrome [Pseudomonas sp. BN411]|uniref:c-type cytochrome n=1 Tax=Pseudomonas sp. BN411 TaxID=2567887 RepID=UPI002458993B|nr:c-type cytochrome [Pseudomonas sp. BN411]MDH4561791.1 cytochrome c [Pseudomonas sp. BN411]
MKHPIYIGALLLAASLHAQAESALDLTRVQTCAACHGDRGQGNPALGAPRLAGQQADYLLQQLQGFKDGRRGYDDRDSHGAQMRAVVASLDEADFAPLARHYADQDAGPNSASTQPDTSGKVAYQGTCAACHGPEAEGYAHLKTANLRILDPAYLERQLSHYAQGLRGADGHADQHGIWMRGIALQIGGDAERKAIVDYIGTLAAGH